MTATTADERSLLPARTWPPSAPSSFLLTDRRGVLADDPCEAGSSATDPEYAGIYLHARYFDPKLGTFLSPDPIGVEGGLNQYTYGRGDPLNSVDPRGLTPDYVFCYPWPTCAGGAPGGKGNVGFQFSTPGGGVDLGPLFKKIAGAFRWFFSPSSNNPPWDPRVPRPTEYVFGKPIDPDSDYELGSLTLVSPGSSEGTSSGGTSTGAPPPPKSPSSWV